MGVDPYAPQAKSPLNRLAGRRPAPSPASQSGGAIQLLPESATSSPPSPRAIQQQRRQARYPGAARQPLPQAKPGTQLLPDGTQLVPIGGTFWKKVVPPVGKKIAVAAPEIIVPPPVRLAPGTDPIVPPLPVNVAARTPEPPPPLPEQLAKPTTAPVVSPNKSSSPALTESIVAGMTRKTLQDTAVLYKLSIPAGLLVADLRKQVIAALREKGLL